MNVREACEIVLGDPLDVILTKCSEHSIDQAVIFALTALEEYPDARAERRPKSEPPDGWRCYGASVASVAPVLAAAAEMFLGAWQHGLVGEYPVNLYL
jgi:hypothetical protein